MPTYITYTKFLAENFLSFLVILYILISFTLFSEKKLCKFQPSAAGDLQTERESECGDRVNSSTAIVEVTTH